MKCNSNLNGLTTALATPLTKKGEIDKPAMRRLVRFVLNEGVNNLFVLGVCGEVMTLDRDMRCQAIEVVKEEAGEEIPVIVGVFSNSTQLVMKNITDAKERGADYVLCTPPDAYPLNQDEILDFYTWIADKGEIPVIAYNCPISKNTIETDTIYTLASHPLIVGLKETSDQEKLQKMQLKLSACSNFTLMSGNEFLYLPALDIGINSAIMGGPGNIIPGWCNKILYEYNNGNIEEARNLYLRMISLLYQLYNMGVNAIAAVKAGLEILGICESYMSHPVRAVSQVQKEKIASLFTEFNI